MLSKISGLNELILKLQEEGINKVNEERDKIIQDANQNAEKIISDAKEESSRIREKCRRDCSQKKEDLDCELRMATRDFLLNFANNIKKFVIRPVVKSEINKVVTDTKFLKNCLGNIFQDVLANEDKSILVILNKDMKNEMIEFFSGKIFKEAKNSKINLAFTDEFQGFQIIQKDEHLLWDFTLETLSQEVGKIVEPNLLKYFI